MNLETLILTILVELILLARLVHTSNLKRQ